MTKSSTQACPICGKPSDPKYRPACSRTCSYIDLGRGLDGSYAVPGAEIVPLAGSGLDGEAGDQEE
jgi:endogenous inhibitor of DNA gyrase (YacG/DUF329 family)